MKAEDLSKAKVPSGKKDEPVAPGDTGLMSKLKFPELPIKQAIAIPMVILAISLIIIGLTYVTTGAPLHLGLDFQGGTMVTMKTDKTDAQIYSEFNANNYPVNLVTTGSNGEKSLRFSSMESDKQQALARFVNDHYQGAIIEHTGSVFSQSNQNQAAIAVLVAFVGMALTVFIIFRNFVPSVAIITAAFADITFAVAMMNIVGVELSFGTFAALLMLIGYSVDTDILLTTKVLGERKYIDKKIASCRTTGLTMTGAAIVAFIVLFLVSTFSFVVGMSTIPVLSSIALVMIFGLVADVFNTWFFNAGLLKWYMESPAGRAKYG